MDGPMEPAWKPCIKKPKAMKDVFHRRTLLLPKKPMMKLTTAAAVADETDETATMMTAVSSLDLDQALLSKLIPPVHQGIPSCHRQESSLHALHVYTHGLWKHMVSGSHSVTQTVRVKARKCRAISSLLFHLHASMENDKRILLRLPPVVHHVMKNKRDPRVVQSH